MDGSGYGPADSFGMSSGLVGLKPSLICCLRQRPLGPLLGPAKPALRIKYEGAAAPSCIPKVINWFFDTQTRRDICRAGSIVYAGSASCFFWVRRHNPMPTMATSSSVTGKAHHTP